MISKSQPLESLVLHWLIRKYTTHLLAFQTKHAHSTLGRLFD